MESFMRDSYRPEADAQSINGTRGDSPQKMEAQRMYPRLLRACSMGYYQPVVRALVGAVSGCAPDQDRK